MTSVEEEVRSTIDTALQKLIAELDKERAVSAKQRSLNEQLISKLTSIEEKNATLMEYKHESELLVQDLRSRIDVLTSKLAEQKTAVVKEEDDDDGESGDITTAMITDDADAKGDQKVGMRQLMEVAIKDRFIPFVKERRRKLIEVIKVTRFTFRGYFGVPFANQYNFYVDHVLSKNIFQYQNWIRYSELNSVLDCNESKVTAAVISNDSYNLYTGTSDGTMFAWNLLTLSIIMGWKVQEKGIFAVAYHSSVLVCTGDRDIFLWNAVNLKRIGTLKGHTDDIYAVNFNQKGDLLVSGSCDRRLRVWSVKHLACLKVLIGHSNSINAALFKGNLIISGGIDRCIKIWNSAINEVLRTVRDKIRGEVLDLAMNCEETYVCCAFYRGTVIYSWPDLRVERSMDINANRCDFHPLLPNIFFIADPIRHDIKMYDVRSGANVHRFEGHNDKISDICFSKDLCHMISASVDTTLRVWNIHEFLLP